MPKEACADAGCGTVLREPDPRIVPRAIVSVGGSRTVAYAEAGSGRDLVLIHGALTTRWTISGSALCRGSRGTIAVCSSTGPVMA